MAIVRVVAILAALLLGGLGIAFLVTRNRRYLRIAWIFAQLALLFAIALALLYVFERVLLL
jgi:ABC-type nitrate/sulfonate/bicarbonate transport system permease component